MRIGLIGLGNMGGRIGEQLIKKGHELVVHDLNEGLLEKFKSLGAEVATSLTELGMACHVVITVLPNAKILQQVAVGENGLINGMSEGAILIDMTSSVPEVTKEVGGALQAKGIHMLDAPVSGGVKRAEDGTLTIMVGGEAETFQKAEAIFYDIGKNVIHVGALGAGHTIKALNNLISATTLSITAEALAVGVKMGLDPTKMLEVINTSSGKNNSSETKFPQQVLTRNFELGFALDLMYKDLGIALDMAKKEQVPTFVSSSVYELWKYASAKGGGPLDHTAIVKYVEDMAGVEIKG